MEKSGAGYGFSIMNINNDAYLKLFQKAYPCHIAADAKLEPYIQF